MEKLKQLFAYIPTVGLLMLLCALPFPYSSFQRFSLYVAGIGYIVDYVLNRRWEGWHWSKEKWAFLILVVFYLCIPIRQLWDPTCNWLFYQKIETYMPFLVLGILGFLGFNHTLKLEYVATAMALTCLYMACVLAYHMAGISVADFHSWRYELNELRIRQLNSHMVVNVYCNMTLVFAAWTLLESSCSRWLKAMIGVLSMGIIVGILMSEGRTGQLTLIALLVAFVIVWFYKKAWLKWLVLAMTVLALCQGVYWYYNPRYHDASVHNNPRLYIWKVGQKMIEEKPVLGWGVSSAREEFIRRGSEDADFRAHYLNEYEGVSMMHTGKVEYRIIHPHNVFIETAMEFGLIGVVLLLLCLVLPICLLPIGGMRWYLAACFFVFAMQAMFESMGSCLLPMWVPLLTLLWRFNSRTAPQTDLSGSPAIRANTSAALQTYADGHIV